MLKLEEPKGLLMIQQNHLNNERWPYPAVPVHSHGSVAMVGVNGALRLVDRLHHDARPSALMNIFG